MKKFNVITALFCFVGLSYSQEMKYDDSSFYLICRGTKSRQSIIANDFNMKDTMITHIGIGYVKDNSLVVFNVSTPVNDKKKSALVVESFDSFTNMNP